MRIDRLSRLALRVLEDAAARAHGGDVERTWGHRLALEYLVRIRIAEPWQAADFWENLAWQCDRYQSEQHASYAHVRDLTGAIHNWSYKLGIKHADHTNIDRLAHAYMPDLETESGTQQLPSMCNRYKPGERETIRSFFDASMFRVINDGPAIVHPKDPGWVVRQVDGKLVLDQMIWGFPVYVRGKAGQPLKAKPTNNARIENLPGYWKQWAQRPEHRCLIAAAAWAEAQGPAGEMTTTWLSVRDTPLFAWAGLWRESEEWGSCYTGLMTESDIELRSVHARAPVILRPQEWDIWLNAPFDELARFRRPFPTEEIKVDATRILWKNGGLAPPNPQAGPPISPARESGPPPSPTPR